MGMALALSALSTTSWTTHLPNSTAIEIYPTLMGSSKTWTYVPVCDDYTTPAYLRNRSGAAGHGKNCKATDKRRAQRKKLKSEKMARRLTAKLKQKRSTKRKFQ